MDDVRGRWGKDVGCVNHGPTFHHRFPIEIFAIIHLLYIFVSSDPPMTLVPTENRGRWGAALLDTKLRPILLVILRVFAVIGVSGNAASFPDVASIKRIHRSAQISAYFETRAG